MTRIKILFAVVLLLCTGMGYSQQLKQSKLTTKTKNMKVLFVLTSNDQLGNTGLKTGFWIEEFATPYYLLIDKGVEVTLASPKGGQPPIDPKSNLPENSTASTKRFFEDKALQKKLSESLELKTVDQKDYDAVFYPGGHGPLWDLTVDKNSIALLESFYSNNKPTALVCHAPGVLKNVKAKNGEPLVKGKKVTGFTNTEEAAVQLTDIVPFLVENMLKENGGTYMHGGDWQPYSVEDGNLITGQNPASSGAVIEKLLAQLDKKN